MCIRDSFGAAQLAVVVVAHGRAVGTGIVDVEHVPDVDLGQHPVDGKLVVVLSLIHIYCDTILNTAVAKELKGYADELEGAEDFTSAAIALIKRTIRDHLSLIHI